MIIYTDEENRVSVSGTKHEIPDDHPLALMSEAKRLCYVYDGESFFPYVSTDIIKKLESQAEENKITKAQIEAQSEQMDFYEDCIAEMASVIYA